jgi:hypothetical protein
MHPQLFFIHQHIVAVVNMIVQGKHNIRLIAPQQAEHFFRIPRNNFHGNAGVICVQLCKPLSQQPVTQALCNGNPHQTADRLLPTGHLAHILCELNDVMGILEHFAALVRQRNGMVDAVK